MAFTPIQLETSVAWCALCEELQAVRRQAQRTFFGEDDDRPARYWPGAGDATSRQRRFLGWFLFNHRLPDGRRPAECAASHLYRGTELSEALEAVRRARYVLAIITSVLPREGVILELEDERFEVRSRQWARAFTKDTALVSHLIPIRRGIWMPGPGWVEWPVRIGPNMRRELKQYQTDPISVERLLQRRARSEDEKRPAPPSDATLERAVARMTEAARREGCDGLVMSPEEWTALVLPHLLRGNSGPFSEEIIRRVGATDDIDKLNHWLALAINIWNTTPQPDRGGKSAYDQTLGRKPAQWDEKG